MSNLRDELKRRKLVNIERNFISSEELIELMKNIDLVSVLKSFGIDVEPVSSKEGEYVGFCPDHEFHTGKKPSHPKWYINAINGKSFCQTEQRASNIVDLTKTLMGLKTDREAIQYLLNGKNLEIRAVPKFAVVKEESPRKLEDEEKLKKSISSIMKVLDAGKLNKPCLDYFSKDGIRIDTLKKYGVGVCEYGAYKDRAIVPFFNKDWNLIGFIAIDYLGKEEWVKRRKEEIWGLEGKDKYPEDELNKLLFKKYKKTLYCPGFKAADHLYGYYENLDYSSHSLDYLVLVEGERDCLKLMQEGIPCVSIHGSSLKEEQTIMIERMCNKEIFLGFDMDDAGDNACKKALKLLEGKVNDLYVLNFPGCKDPKKFNGSELLSLIDKTRRDNIRSRSYEGICPA